MRQQPLCLFQNSPVCEPTPVSNNRAHGQGELIDATLRGSLWRRGQSHGATESQAEQGTEAGAEERSQRDTVHPLVLIVREKLLTLGDFARLLVSRSGDHLFIAHAGPHEAPDDLDPVLRITHAGHWRFGALAGPTIGYPQDLRETVY